MTTMNDGARHRSATIKPTPPPLTVPVPAPARQKFVPFARPVSPTATTAPATTPTQTTTRFRAHLAHLLPRHAAFTVTITLHQLHNVPLVHGEFGLKWRIKGVTSHSGHGILDKVKARKAKPNPSTSGPTDQAPPPSLMTKGSSDTDTASVFNDTASVSDAHSAANSTSTHSPSLYSSNGHTTARIQGQPLPIPAVIVSVNHPSPSLMARSESVASVSSLSSGISSPSSQTIGLSSAHNPPNYLTADWSRQQFPTSSSSAPDTELHPDPAQPGPKAPVPKGFYSPSKGMTHFVRLKEHSVVWEQNLKFVVQMSVARDNGELGDCLAKFVVMQRVVSGDPDAPRNPRLGAVYLNLAEYVNAGVVSRRYLLRQSKTNATLKLTVHVQHTAGETVYVAPPLPKAEILSGVAGLLESSDVFRTRPRASDLYTRVPSDSSSDDDQEHYRHDHHNHDNTGVASGSDASSSVLSGSGRGDDGASSGGHATVSKPKSHRRPLDVSKLPMINDPRGTEKLIEALFNPVPVTEPDKISPFTYLIEVDGEGEADGDHDDEGEDDDNDSGNREGQRGKVDKNNNDHNDHDDDASLYADSQDGSAGEGQGQGPIAASGMGSEYHSLRSRRSFPNSLRSKRSVRSLAGKVALGLGLGQGRDEGNCPNGEETTATLAVPVSVSGVAATITRRGSPGAKMMTTTMTTTERRTWWQKVLSLPPHQ